MHLVYIECGMISMSYIAFIHQCTCAYTTHNMTHTGAPITFPLQVRPARNFPIDLYLLMDLSFSMRDDLDNLKRLGADLGMYLQVHDRLKLANLSIKIVV